MRSDLQHHRSLLLCIDGDVGAGHPGVRAQVPEPDIGVSEEGWERLFTPDVIYLIDDLAAVTELKR